MLSSGSGSVSMVFEPRLKLKAQSIEPEEPVHKISLEILAIQYFSLFLKLLLLDTKIKFNHSLQHIFLLTNDSFIFFHIFLNFLI
jgi:hypothetical protein